MASLCLSVSTSAQTFVVRNNLVYDAALTPNLGFDVRLSNKWSLGANVGYRPWPTSDLKDRKWRHLLIAPELRHWNDSIFKHKSTYWGLNLIYSHYNVGNVTFPFGMYKSVRHERKEGDLFGVGAFYGYTFRLNRIFRMELEAGVGVGLTKYDRFECGHCGAKLGNQTKAAFIPKLAVNIVLDPRKKAPSNLPQLGEAIRPAEKVVEEPVVVEEPTVIEEPVVEQPTVAEQLAYDHPVLVDYANYKAYTRDRVLRKEPGMLYVHYPLNSAELKEDYRDNRATLDEIINVTRQICADTRSDIRLIQIIGLASIEGSVQHNENLAQQRAESLHSYIQQQVGGLDDSLFEIVGGGEAWSEFRDQVNDLLLETSDDAQSRAQTVPLTRAQINKVLEVIDVEADATRRLQQLRRLEGGSIYKVLAASLLSDQRNSGYLRIYYDKR